MGDSIVYRFMGNSIANRCMCNSLDNIVMYNSLASIFMLCAVDCKLNSKDAQLGRAWLYLQHLLLINC